MRPEPRGVVVPRGVLIALVAALAVAMLMAVFLLGRQSARTPVASAPAATAPLGAAPEPADTAPTASTLLPGPSTDAPSTFPTVPPAAGLPAASAGSVSPQERADVARYFQEADGIQARAKYWSDPQALAKTLIEQMGSGRTEAFDQLVSSQRQARDELARMSVPAPCAEHHRRSLDALSGGLSLLEKLQATIASGDLGSLESLPTAGRDLEREAREIDELGRQIRQRYGG
jgi:hypothetical protein